MNNKAHVSKALDGDLAVPLVVDFDGTMHLSDLNWEGIVWLLKTRPWLALRLGAIMLTRGRAAMKLQLEAWAEQYGWLPSLPWESRVLERAAAEAASGRQVVVVTGSTTKLVEKILRANEIPYEVVGTVEPGVNLVGPRKAAFLVERWGAKGFDYVGNSKDDLHVWKQGRYAAVRGGSKTLRAGAAACCEVKWAVDGGGLWVKAFWRAMRPHQWLKNLLVVVPLVTAHLWGSPEAWAATALAFVAFCLTASGAYLLNDLLDIHDDRNHATKRFRPLAAGLLPLPLGLVGAAGLTFGGLVLGFAGGLPLGLVVAGYLCMTLGYSFYLKRLPMADVAVLAALYGMRMLGGAVATDIPLSHWLVLLAFLIFYSLALLKRYVELRALPARSPGKAGARGYLLGDADILAMQGVGSGLLGGLVVALYTSSDDVLKLYDHPAVLALLCPLLVWGMGRLWLLAHRGQVHDDPVVFAAKDPVTWGLGIVALFLMVVAAA